jgi:hypothetical protein
MRYDSFCRLEEKPVRSAHPLFVVVALLFFAGMALTLSACPDDRDLGGGGVAPVIHFSQWGQFSDGVIGVPYEYEIRFVHDSVPVTSCLITAGVIPPGLVETHPSPDVLRLAGTPTSVGTFSVTGLLEAGASDWPFLATVTILPPGSLVVGSSAPSPTGMVGVPFSLTLTASGGTGVGYTWSILNGSLPPGISLDGNNVTLAWSSFTQTGALSQALGGGKLSEVSGICASRSQPGVFWVHDDSGASSSFYAIDVAGNVLQEYTLAIAAVDWEDIALDVGPGSGDYLLIADVGDNALARSDCRLLRVPEPVVPATPQSAIMLSHEAFYFTYPGGAQNCETLLVDWDTSTPYLVEKTAGAVRVHRFPMPLAPGWTVSSPATLLPVAASGLPSTLTAGDVSLDARRMILRGYGGAWEYVRQMGAPFESLFSQSGVPVTVPSGQQYEAICYSGDGTKLITTTELAAQPSAPIWSSDATPGPNSTTISGTPTTACIKWVVVQVTDSAGNKSTRGIILVIN